MGTKLVGEVLRELLAARGWKVPQLAAVSGYSRQYLYELTGGRTTKRPSATVVEDLDVALAAGGRLVQAWGVRDVKERHDVNRRTVITEAGLLALTPALAAGETARQALAAALGMRSPVDMWDEAIGDYARNYYLLPAAELLSQLLADTEVITRQLVAATGEQRTALTRPAAILATMTALSWSSLGQTMQSARWWGIARHTAEHSGDRHTRTFTASWELVSGLHQGRPLPQLLALGERATADAGDQADAPTAMLWAGLAQSQAVAGHPDAVASLRRVEEMTTRMPADIARDTTTVFGWPEARLHHTRSYVLTAAGRTAAAYQAQDSALALYGSTLAPDRSAVELHRARCLVTDGRIAEGIAEAHRVLDHLPAARSGSVRTIAVNVLTSVPSAARRATEVAALRERLALTS